jgi:DNA-binding NtrC family response regulator
MPEQPEKRRVLVVDDDAGVVSYLVEMLGEQGYVAKGLSDPRQAVEEVAEGGWDLVVTDVEMPAMRGTDLMAAIQARRPGQLVLLMTAFGSINLAVQAMQLGACDFLAKPFPIEKLFDAVETALRNRRLRRQIVRLREEVGALPRDGGPLVAKSPAMVRVLEVARRAAQAGSTVLLTGESGTGKGAVARFIHDSSPRRDGPFVQVNCGGLPTQLVESELFGVRRGAYTDAREHRDGLFQQASGGTLFLDEIGEMPLEAQPKLLQVLETGRVRPVGASADVSVDVRVVAATNRPLAEAVRDRAFRADLYYRLNVISAEIPPLRERAADIEPLAMHLLELACRKLGRPITGLSQEAIRWLRSYSWPGNVRELSNTVERAVALSDHDTLVLEDLAVAFGEVTGHDFLATAAARQLPLEEIERAYIRMVLDSCEGNKTKAAKVLGIDRRTLYRKLTGTDPAAGEE